MPLRFTGNKATDSETFQQLLEAMDGGKRVVVLASDEAIQDYGLGAVQDKAEEKYDAGQVEPNGRVKVFTTDFSR